MAEAAMPEVAIKVKVPANRKVTVDIPADIPEGEEVSIVVRPVTRLVHGRERILAVLNRIAAEPHGPEPTKEELDSEIQDQRDSWE
jgi:hypothetical protein